MEKDIVVLSFDYFQGAIMISDVETGEPLTGIDIIDNDDEIRKLNKKAFDLYISSETFDENSIPIGTDKKLELENKDKMLVILHKLINRLNEINDGTYEVEDRLTDYYEHL